MIKWQTEDAAKIFLKMKVDFFGCAAGAKLFLKIQALRPRRLQSGK